MFSTLITANLLNFTHGVENAFMLDPDRHAHFLSFFLQLFLELLEGNRCLCRIDDHHHREDILQDRLIDVENIDIIFRQHGSYLVDNTDFITADYRYHCFHNFCLSPLPDIL